MPNKTRFEREIDEILEKSEGDTKSRPPRKRQFEPFSPNVPKSPPPRKSVAIRFSPGNLIIVGVIVLAVAAFVPVARLPLAILGFALVTVGYVLWFRRGGSFSRGPSARGGVRRSAGSSTKNEPQVKYWRGRRIEEKPDRSDSQGSKDRGKIIEFRPPADYPDPDDQDQNDRNKK